MLVDYLTKLKCDRVSLDFENKLLAYLDNYYIVGGMPEVVNEWITNKNIEKVELIQERIINSYELDFSKHTPLYEIPKLNYVWKYIPRCLSKENSKFIYGNAKPGARAKDLEDALGWLINAGLCYKVSRIEKHAFPLSSYIDLKSFKIYMCDVGLLRKKAKLDAFIILSNDDNMYKEFKGAIAENFVLLELLSINDNLPYYWTSGNSAKLDFVWQLKDKILPIEVKSGKNIYAKGLSVYIDKYNPKLSIKISKRNLLKQNNIINIPLYLIWNIENII